MISPERNSMVFMMANETAGRKALQEISEDVLRDYRRWFKDHLTHLEIIEDRIRDGVHLKARHTIHVCAEIRWISKRLGLSAGQIRLAEALALFHDVGRFEQYTKHGAFLDRETVNHATLGVETMEKAGLLSRLHPVTAEILRKSVLFHNRKDLPDDEDETVLFFARLVRDADKLDIWRIVTAYYTRPPEKKVDAIDLNLPEEPDFSPQILADIRAGRSVDENHMRTQGDFKLMQIAWVYDLNYAPSYQRVKQRGYLRKIRTTMPDSPVVGKILGQAELYLDSKCKQSNENG